MAPIDVRLPELDHWKAQVKCQSGCPVRTDAGRYVQLIAEGRNEDAYLVARAPWHPLGETHFWTTSPSQFLMRAGLVCLVVSALAMITLRFRPRVQALEALAQASLAVYIIHICLVYGSPFNTGLRQLVGATQTPLQAALWAGQVRIPWLPPGRFP